MIRRLLVDYCYDASRILGFQQGNKTFRPLRICFKDIGEDECDVSSHGSIDEREVEIADQ